jgi:hypothetical protein
LPGRDFVGVFFQTTQALFEHGSLLRYFSLYQVREHANGRACSRLVEVLEQLQLHFLLFRKVETRLQVRLRGARYLGATFAFNQSLQQAAPLQLTFTHGLAVQLNDASGAPL